MGKLKELIRGDAVHVRRIEIRTYPAEGNRVVVEGRLNDERLIKGYYWDGRGRTPGVVHGMCVRMLVGEWPLRIIDVEAEMTTVPHEQCQTTLETIKQIVGLPIVSGYSDEVKNRIGGVEGCAHLSQLIVNMGPAALHGYWTQRSRERLPTPGSINDFKSLEYLADSCRLWRRDGPIMRDIKAMFEGTRSDD